MNLVEFEGTSVHYWASPIEARLCAGQEVALVGAGNSAGQAAVYLASQVRKVTMLARRDSLDATMSRYLVERIAAQPNIEVMEARDERRLLRFQKLMAGYKLLIIDELASCRSPKPERNCCSS